jgi:hypothetical protein
MSFFEPPPAPDEPEPYAQPVWASAPDNQLGVAVPLRVILLRTEELAILIDQVVAYTTGFSFRLAGRRRAGATLANERGFEHVLSPHHDDMDRLLVGIEFADGRKATNLTHGPTDSEGDGPMLMTGGGAAGGGRFDFQFWVWPLPPDGPLTFAIQWADQDVELTRAPVESSPIREAGALSEPLWPELGGGSGSGGVSFRPAIAWRPDAK